MKIILLLILYFFCVINTSSSAAAADEKYELLEKKGKKFYFNINMNNLILNKNLNLIKNKSNLEVYLPEIKKTYDEKKLKLLIEKNYINRCLSSIGKNNSNQNDFYYSILFKEEFVNNKIYSYSINIKSDPCYEKGHTMSTIIYGGTLNIATKRQIFSHELFSNKNDKHAEENSWDMDNDIMDALITSFIENSPNGSCKDFNKIKNSKFIRDTLKMGFAPVDVPTEIPFILTKNKEFVFNNTYTLPTDKPWTCEMMDFQIYLPIKYEALKKLLVKDNPLSKYVD